MMFHLLKRKESCKEVPIYAIANGTLADLEEVEDITFSEKLLGDGVAFQYEGDIIYAPCAGEVILVSATRHAIGIQAENGAELMVHCGLETVNLQGKGLTPLVKAGEKVKKGTPILSIDRDFMREKEISLITPVIITNGDGYELVNRRERGKVTTEDIVCVVSKS